MKSDTIILTLAAAAGVAFIASAAMRKPAQPARGTAGTLNNGGNYYGTGEIPNTALPGQPGWGWRYYTDGTAIGPDGTYYYNGQAVYAAQ